VDLLADPLLALMSVRPLMPNELYLEPVREPWDVYPRDISQPIPHQAARYHCDEVAAGDDARDNEKRRGKRDNGAGVTEGFQGDIHRRRKCAARRRDNHLFKPGEPGCSRPLRNPWVPGAADQDIALLKQMTGTQVGLRGIRCGDGEINITIR
jgi:hypothetical protein